MGIVAMVRGLMYVLYPPPHPSLDCSLCAYACDGLHMAKIRLHNDELEYDWLTLIQAAL